MAGTDYHSEHGIKSWKNEELVAFEAIEKFDYSKALDILRAQDQFESEYTLNALGWLYETGKAGPTDVNLAKAYYSRAVAIGSVESYFRIGMLELAQGNEIAARNAFLEGAIAGHLPAMSKVGEMMCQGSGGPVEADRGIRLLQSASEKGHVLSKIRLKRLEISRTDNFFMKLILRMQLLYIGKKAVLGLRKDINSDTVYEFR